MELAAGRRGALGRKKKLRASELLGQALAAGIGYGDFCRLTPEEWAAAAAAIAERRKEQARDAWERARMLGAAALAPYLRKGQKADPRKLFPLPWDGEKGEATPPMTREEAKKRFLELTSKDAK